MCVNSICTKAGVLKASPAQRPPHSQSCTLLSKKGSEEAHTQTEGEGEDSEQG